MARAPNAKAEKARELFLSGKKLIEISEILEVPEGTIRSWKNRYRWEHNDDAAAQQKKVQRCKQEKCNVADVNQQLVDSVLENRELRAEQQLFCVLVAFGKSATTAYQKAYGCTYQTAMANSSRLLRNAKIQEEVKRLRKERFEAQIFDEHDIFQWHLDVAMASITDYVDFGREKVQAVGAFGPIVDKVTGEPVMKEVNYVKFKPSSEVNGHVIKKVKMGKDGASIELYDAMAAMQWLADHMNMGTNAQQTLAQNIMGAYEKRRQQEGGADHAGAE